MTADSIERKKAKGIKKCVINREITFDDFKNCLRHSLPGKEKQRLMKFIRSKNI